MQFILIAISVQCYFKRASLRASKTWKSECEGGSGKKERECSFELTHSHSHSRSVFSTRSGNWTRTAITGHRILSPACLPIPPSGRSYLMIWWFDDLLSWFLMIWWNYVLNKLFLKVLLDAEKISNNSSDSFIRGLNNSFFKIPESSRSSSQKRVSSLSSTTMQSLE